MLKVWGRRSAYNVQKVLWTIAELDLPHEHVDAGGAAGGLNDPAFLEMNPHGRIPVISDSGVVVWESNSIVRYLAAKHGAGSLWPADPAERSLADRWMDWELATFQPDFLKLFWGYFRTPETQRNHHEIGQTLDRCIADFTRLDSHLSKSAFLAGPRFSMGDIPIGTSLYRWFGMGLPVPELSHVRSWYERLALRPAFQRTVMVSFEELRGRLEY